MREEHFWVPSLSFSFHLALNEGRQRFPQLVGVLLLHIIIAEEEVVNSFLYLAR